LSDSNLEQGFMRYRNVISALHTYNITPSENDISSSYISRLRPFLIQNSSEQADIPVSAYTHQIYYY